MSNSILNKEGNKKFRFNNKNYYVKSLIEKCIKPLNQSECAEFKKLFESSIYQHELHEPQYESAHGEFKITFTNKIYIPNNCSMYFDPK